jgi:hypothetical protein
MKRKNPGLGFKSCKRRGEWAEMVFAGTSFAGGAEFGASLGESCGYDFVVDQGGRMLRVQVKSTIYREGEEGYVCTLSDSKGPYKKNSFEFVAAYVIPDDVWFILPEKKIRGMWSIGLYPKLESAKWRNYQEAWDLLPGAPDRGITIRACAEEERVRE